MPSLADYVRLAPFTLDETVEAVNSVLRSLPKLHVTARTVKFYIAKGLTPGPVGSPRTARYSMEHVLRVVANRCLPQRGLSLEDAKEEVDRLLTHDLATAIDSVQGMVDDLVSPTFQERTPPSAPRLSAVVREAVIPGARAQTAVTVRRIPLRVGVTLEVAENVDLRETLDEIIRALEEAARTRS